VFCVLLTTVNDELHAILMLSTSSCELMTRRLSADQAWSTIATIATFKRVSSSRLNAAFWVASAHIHRALYSLLAQKLLAVTARRVTPIVRLDVSKTSRFCLSRRALRFCLLLMRGAVPCVKPADLTPISFCISTSPSFRQPPSACKPFAEWWLFGFRAPLSE
jgi:hypothetical protein